MTKGIVFDNVTEALYFESKHHGQSHGITFVTGNEDTCLSYREVFRRARETAFGLKELGVKPGQPLIQIIPTGPSFLDVFFGAMLLGATPSPVSSPMGFGGRDAFIHRVGQMAELVEAHVLIVEPRLKELVCAAVDPKKVRVLSPDEIPLGQGEVLRAHSSTDEPAFIQFTSGSTSRPKGTILSHGAVSSNVYQAGWGMEIRHGDRMGTWLPLYHDMGLIGCLILSVFWNLDSYFLRPSDFLRAPASWMQTISRHNVTLSPAPAFAYGYCTNRIKDEDLEGVDLSHWRLGFVGAEPINPDELRGFIDRFSRWGLKETTPFPCYGLAEACLAVTFPGVEERFRSVQASRQLLAERRFGPPVEPDDAVELVSVGWPLPEMKVEIQDDEGNSLPPGQVGEIVVRGPTVFSGYYRQPDVTAHSLKDGALYTGDLGFIGEEDDLFITGRKKDLIIIRGQNYLPSEFEWVTSRVPGVRTGNVAAFGLPHPTEATEILALMAETRCEDDEQKAALEREIKRAVLKGTGVAVGQIFLVEPGSVPKTSSGKIQRSRARQLVLQHLAADGSTP